MKRVSETFIVEPNGPREYLVLLPGGDVRIFPTKEAVLAMINRRGKRKAGKDGIHTATIEWRNEG